MELKINYNHSLFPSVAIYAHNAWLVETHFNTECIVSLAVSLYAYAYAVDFV